MGYLSGEVGYKLINLILFYIFVNQLTKEAYALYGLIMANIAIFSIFVRFGMHAAINRYYHDKKTDYSELLGTVFMLYIVVLIIYIISAIFLYNFILSLYATTLFSHKEFQLIYCCIVIIGANIFFFDSILEYMNATRQVKDYNKIRLGFLFSVLVITLLLYYGVFQSLLYAYLAAMLVSYFFITTYSIYYFLNSYTIRLLFNQKQMKEVIFFAAPLFVNNAMQFVIIHINKFILNNYTDVSTVAEITFITNLTAMIESVVFVFNIAWLPNFYSMMNRCEYEKIRMIIKRTLTMVFSLLGIYYVLSLNIITIISGDKYTNIHFESLVYLASIIFTFIYIYYTQYLFYYKTTILLMPITAISALASFALNVILIKYFGLLGAVIAFLLVKIIMVFLIYLFIQQKASEILPLKTFFASVFVWFLLFMVVLIVLHYLQNFAVAEVLLKTLLVAGLIFLGLKNLKSLKTIEIK